MRIFLTLALFSLVFFGLRCQAKAAQAVCGAEYFSGVGAQLRAIEAERPHDASAVFARDRELGAILTPPGAPIWQATAQPCPSETRSIQLRDLARQRVLALWTRMLALRAVDAPVYPTPYAQQCLAWDVRSWQVAFIAAWVESIRPVPPFAALELHTAIAADPEYAHVRALALERARRFRVMALPKPGDDGETWLQANLRARNAAAPQAQRCGPAVALFALTEPAIDELRLAGGPVSR